jgi:RND family efflux transporter MFP subunit
MTPARTLIIAAFAAGVVGGVSATPLRAQAAKDKPAGAAAITPSVTVAQARLGDIAETVIVGGTLVAREEVLVAAQVEGLAITEILVEEGQGVAKGQVLARLSRETIDTSLAQNTAQIARAEAAIAQTRNTISEAQAAQGAAAASFDRTRQLRKDGIASAETFDQREATARQTTARLAFAREQLRLAEADLALSKAARRELEIRLARTDIRAPAGGVVSRRSARVGAIAAGAGEPLFRLIEDGAIELEADVAEASLVRIKAGQPAWARPAGFGEDVQGKVRLVSSEVSRTTRLGRVRIALADSAGLTIGAFARGRIEVARSKGVLVPLSAVQFGAQGTQAQVVGQGRVEVREVRTGLRQNGLIEIVSGVQPGEEIVLVAGSFLRHGDRVNAVAAPSAAPAAAVN